jgi:hypothetical protein
MLFAALKKMLQQCGYSPAAMAAAPRPSLTHCPPQLG